MKQKTPARALSDLKPNEKNPRRITDKRRDMLKKSLEAFGDLGGIIKNLRTNRLVGGHQRRDALQAAGAEAIVIERRYDPPTKVGTVAEGYALLHGERFAYRETDWSEEAEQLANLAANRSAGDFDQPLLADIFADLAECSLDLNLSMFGENERASLIATPAPPAEEESVEHKARAIICPSCHHEFFPTRAD